MDLCLLGFYLVLMVNHHHHQDVRYHDEYFQYLIINLRYIYHVLWHSSVHLIRIDLETKDNRILYKCVIHSVFHPNFLFRRSNSKLRRKQTHNIWGKNFESRKGEFHFRSGAIRARPVEIEPKQVHISKS
jgi:hypothetical protein